MMLVLITDGLNLDELPTPGEFLQENHITDGTVSNVPTPENQLNLCPCGYRHYYWKPTSDMTTPHNLLFHSLSTSYSPINYTSSSDKEKFSFLIQQTNKTNMLEAGHSYY